MPRIHELKTLTPHFNDVKAGKKRAELRLDDRGYAVGDMLILREWTGSEYTGRRITASITHILKDCGFGLLPGWAILSLGNVRYIKQYDGE